MKNVTSFALGALVCLGAASSAWAAGETPQRESDRAVTIAAAATPTAPAATDEFIVTAKRSSRREKARTPPAMPIEIPRLELAIPAPPVVRL